MFSDRELHNALLDRHASLALFQPEQIIAALGRPQSAKAKRRLVVEACVRYFLSGAENVSSALSAEGCCPKELFSGFMDWCLFEGQNSDSPLLPESFVDGCSTSEVLQLNSELISRLRELIENVDGFIPVFAEDGRAFFLPFSVETANNKVQVRDKSSRHFDEWERCLAEPLRLAGFNAADIRLLDAFPVKVKGCGASLTLPVLLALWRKDPVCALPRYNVFKVIATGGIGNSGYLAPVAVDAKIAGFARAFYRDAVFLYPEDGSDRQGGNCVALKRCRLTDLKEQIHRIIESDSRCCHLAARDVLSRLDAICGQVDSQYARWEETINRLVRYRDALSPKGHTAQWLRCTMYLGIACCHAGQTQSALEYNREAKEFADKLDGKFSGESVRIGIDYMVLLTDREEFDKLWDYAQELKPMVEKENDTDHTMRFYGTLGQACAYCCLCGIEGASAEKAKEYFLRALDCAWKLESPADIAQDSNNILLWHSLFEPCGKSWREAKAESERAMRNLSGDVMLKNKYHIWRIVGLGVYRHLLQGGNIADCTIPYRQMSADAEFWIRAVGDKYAGAVAAAKGDLEQARALFAAADKAVEKDANPIIRYIHLTVLAEAWRSLGEADYKERALALANSLAKEFHLSIPAWQKFLRGEGDFPGLKYWY